MPKYVLDRPMALTAAPHEAGAQAVEDSDSRARYVLGGAGTEIPEDDARRYGLLPAEDAPSADAPADDRGPFQRMLDSKNAQETSTGGDDEEERGEGEGEGDDEEEEEEDVTGGTVAEVLAHADTVEDAAEIQRMLDSENAQEKPRKTLVEGLEKRLAQLGESGGPDA